MKWFNFKNQGETAEMYFYGDILGSEADKFSHEDKCPSDIIEAVKACEGKAIDVYINSCGGSVFGGIAIYNILKRHTGKKTVHIDGIAGSIASVIAMCGDEILIPENAYLMIHKPWIYGAGNAIELRKTADDLDKIEKGIIAIYCEKLAEGMTETDIVAMMEAETWLTGADAMKVFTVKKTKGVSALNCSSKLISSYHNAPKTLTVEIVKEERKIETMKDSKEIEKKALIDIQIKLNNALLS